MAVEFGGFLLLPGLFRTVFPQHVPRQLDSHLFISDPLTQVCRAGPNLVYPVTRSVRFNVECCCWKLTCVSQVAVVQLGSLNAAVE